MSCEQQTSYLSYAEDCHWGTSSLLLLMPAMRPFKTLLIILQDSIPKAYSECFRHWRALVFLLPVRLNHITVCRVYFVFQIIRQCLISHISIYFAQKAYCLVQTRRLLSLTLFKLRNGNISTRLTGFCLWVNIHFLYRHISLLLIFHQSVRY